MPRTVVHQVKKGENLEKIAKRYGVKSFKIIYEDPVNAKFRKTRPDPNAIQPGDKIIIPDYALTPDKRKDVNSLIATVEERIKHLEAARKDQIKTTSQLASEIRSGKASFKKTAQAADAAAMLATLFMSIGKIVAKGAKMSTMKATEVAKANKDILKEVTGMRLTALEPALQAGASKMSKSSTNAIAVLGITGDSFFKMTSPSFWGKTFIKARNEGLFKKVMAGQFGEGWDAWSKAVTWDPLKEFDVMIRQMEAQSAKIVKSMDLMIAENKALRDQLRKVAAK
ncbi:MAG: LysM domain-containing protein [Aestuariivita sp.]|uniref:LysM peptidoglycan-binding domain-containing protein n=1 Tax=Aestuariivita sp. TaxID=1872407 RepID=UPI003BAEDF5A